jgi:hypothetical protein
MPKSETPVDLIPENGFVIEFPGVSSPEASRCAAELEQLLKDELADTRSPASVERLRIEPEAQDLGTVLAIILGAKATIELAKGISKWLSRHNQGKLRLRTRDGREVAIDNIESKDIPATLKALI